MTKLILTLLTTLLALISTSCATHPSPDVRTARAASLFDQLDTNHDGYLTRAELAAGLSYAGTPDVNPNLVLGMKSESRKSKASRKLTKAEAMAMLRAAMPRPLMAIPEKALS